MVENGYSRKFTQKAISWQLKRDAVNAKRTDSKYKETTFEEPEAPVPKYKQFGFRLLTVLVRK